MTYQYSERDGIVLNASKAVRLNESFIIQHHDGSYYMIADINTLTAHDHKLPEKIDWILDDLQKTGLLDEMNHVRAIQMHVEDDLHDVVIAYYFVNGSALAISMDHKVTIPIVIIDADL